MLLVSMLPNVLGFSCSGWFVGSKLFDLLLKDIRVFKITWYRVIWRR